MDEIKDKLMSLSDDEKLYELKFEKNYYNVKMMIMSLQSDELKLQMIDKLHDDDKEKLIESLQSDNLKLEYLKSMKQDNQSKKEDIAKSIKSDELKIQTLSLFNDYYRRSIILTLQSDEKKIEAMKQYVEPYEYIQIIKNLSSVENKIANLSLLEMSYQRQEVVESIKILTDEQRLKIATYVKDEDIAFDVIIKSEDEGIRIKALDLFSKDYKIEIICSLKDDKTKIEQLEQLSDEGDKVRVIISLKDDNKKIERLQQLSNESSKARVIISLQDDKTKIEKLEQLNNEVSKAAVIISLRDDNEKIEQLKQLKDEGAKAAVINSLKDDNEKIKQLEQLNDELAKTEVIISLRDDNEKIEQLKQLKDEGAKAAVINSLKDDKNKIEQLEKIDNKVLKTIILETIQRDEKSTESLLIDRKKLKERFLDENRTYTDIGLDNKMTIGMEIESEGSMSEAIMKLGVIAQREHNGETIGWETEEDGSLNNGVEVKSPILTDNKKDVEDIYIVCSILQECGNNTSERCGGHIHIGADYLKSKEAYINLFEIWGNAEKIICKMSNETGSIPRIGLQEYAVPISPKLNEAIESETVNLENEEDLEQFIDKVQKVQGERYSGLNLLNINNGKNTIEFRIPNGTINPDTWIENARLFGRIIQVSQKLVDIEKQPQNSKEERLVDLKNQLKEEEIAEQEKMEILLELLFSEEERQVYRERYITSSKLLEQTPDEQNPFSKSKFSLVDFKKKKHCLAEFHDVAINDRIETTNEAIRETAQGFRTEDNLEQTNNSKLEEI